MRSINNSTVEQIWSKKTALSVVAVRAQRDVVPSVKFMMAYISALKLSRGKQARESNREMKMDSVDGGLVTVKELLVVLTLRQREKTPHKQTNKKKWSKRK